MPPASRPALFLLAILLGAAAPPPPEAERAVPGGRDGFVSDGAGGCWLWVGGLEANQVLLRDPADNPMGSKGIGEIGIVGSPAVIVNAVWHATGVRVRDLPVRLDKLLEHLA